MTLRNSHKRRPPFVFGTRARSNNLPCDAKITPRGSFPTYFAEYRMFPGPQALAVTGDNSFDTLFGATWAVLFCDNNDFYLMQWNGSGWTTTTDPLLTLPTFTGSERSFTGAFDQAARLILAYEDAEVVHVTRWNTDVNEYVSDVTFAGVDPVLLQDASVTRAVPDSDAILFYLSTDRTTVHYRVQRESYGTEHMLQWGFAATDVTFANGAVLDYAQALDYRFELLVAHASGVKRSLAIVSDLYPIPVSDELGVTAVPGLGAHRQTTYLEESADQVDVTAVPGVGIYSLTITQHTAAEQLDVTGAPGLGLYVETTTLHSAAEQLDVTAAPGDGVYDRTSFGHSAAEQLDIGAAPGTGAYREV